ncbi:U4/U6.U5 small nuclear ribonucleoprotein 27 kDa protein isoform X1 [Phyllopteryx taeniolatus]|uniref:U4/U6.U5 small nuclear ribonucleoprotein 27 kDa protein isoform X1 n=1 Tax=Phyllopteryx taeniolatus TaxID=161469 RepID=UPI002AD3CDEA|nr:U4/U6.U5 small nuclear ribonucleoprotein 27 kDa protein isoform X1 [Phyllopteryx taeniolatus]
MGRSRSRSPPRRERRRSRSTSRERDRRRRERDRSRDRDRERRRSRSRSPHRRRSSGPEKTIKVATTVIQVTQSEDATTSLAVYVSLCRSPRRHRSSSLSPVRQKDRREDERKEKSSKPIQISAEDMQGKTEEEIEMMKLMGFATFDSTKGKKSEGATNAYAVNTTMKRKYRQYMNRKGGFNRPLDFIA